MNSISISYQLIYRFKNAHHYQVSKCGKVFNTKTGRKIKRCYNSGSVGYWISINSVKKFVRISDKKLLERIPKEILPF